MKAFIATLFLCLLITSAANAQDDMNRFPGWHKGWIAQPAHRPRRIYARAYYGGEVIGGRPQGCPHRFCGCALALKIFGVAKRDLWLAANWLRFPRAVAAPGMVAARRGHVFRLEAHIEGSNWRVYDPNSGGGRIRIHARSISGYVIVNPSS